MLVSLFSKGYRVILFTSLFDLFLFDSKIETICKDKKMKRTIKQRFVFTEGISYDGKIIGITHLAFIFKHLQ